MVRSGVQCIALVIPGESEGVAVCVGDPPTSVGIGMCWLNIKGVYKNLLHLSQNIIMLVRHYGSSQNIRLARMVVAVLWFGTTVTRQ